MRIYYKDKFSLFSCTGWHHHPISVCSMLMGYKKKDKNLKKIHRWRATRIYCTTVDFLLQKQCCLCFRHWIFTVMSLVRKSVVTMWPWVLSSCGDWADAVTVIENNDGNKLWSPSRNSCRSARGKKPKHSSVPRSADEREDPQLGIFIHMQRIVWYPADSSVFIELFQRSVSASDMMIYSLIRM